MVDHDGRRGRLRGFQGEGVDVRRIHHVSCSITSDDMDTDDYENATALAIRLERYACKLGFAVMYENVDGVDAFRDDAD